MSRNLDYAKIARHPSQSVAPELWPSHAWVPAFGPTGAMLFDLCGGKHAIQQSIRGWTIDQGKVALDFEQAQSDYFLAPGTNIGASGAITIFSLFKRESYGQAVSTDSFLISQWNSGLDKRSFGLMANAYTTSNKFSFVAAPSGTTDGVIKLDTNASDGVWKTLCGTINSAASYLYEDGVLKTSGSGLSSIYYNSAQATYIGARADKSTVLRFFDGLLGCIYLFDKALSAKQVADLTKDPLLPFRRSLPVFYSVPSAGGGAAATCFLDGILRIRRNDTNLLDGKVAVQSKATNLLDGKAVVRSSATNLLDGKTIIKDTTTNLLDGKVTIKDTVSRLLDGKVIIRSSATNLLDGKLFIQSGATKLLDGKVVIKDTVTNLLDGLVIVSSAGDALKALDGKLNIVKTTTTLLDGKVVIQYTSEDLLDGKLIVKDTTTNLLDGKMAIQNLSTSNLDGNVTIKDTTTNLLDGKVAIKDIATRLLDGKVTVIAGTSVTLDGKVVVKSETSTVVDGKVVVKDTATTLLDGTLFVTTGEETDLLDGRLTIIKTRPNHLTNAQVKALIEGITHKDPVPQSSAINVRLKSKSGKQSNTATVIIEPDE